MPTSDPLQPEHKADERIPTARGAFTKGKRSMTRNLLIASVAMALCGGVAFADHKVGHTQNNPDAPGQDRVCLVTTSGGVRGTITATKWLPRKAAEAQADNQNTFVSNRWTQTACESFSR
jgi:hypothetical protein